MISRHNRLTGFVLTAALALGSAFGQQGQSQNPTQNPPPRKESSKYRIILTAAGAGGGFTLGVFAGIAAYDDAVNSDRKVWTLALVSAAAGGVGGYFLGRAIDKRHGPTSAPVTSDNLDRSLMKAQYRLDGRPAGFRSERWATALAFCPPQEAEATICPSE